MNCCGGGTFANDVACEASVEGRASLAEEQLRLSAHSDGNGLLQSDFLVPSMHCAGCLRKIESRLNNLPFVDRARANLSTKRVSVFWREDEGTATAISAELKNAGYENTPFDLGMIDSDDGKRTARRLLMSLAVAGFAAANIMLLSVSVWSGADAETAQLFHLISGLIAIPAVAYTGQPFFKSALGALSGRSLNMDVPISLAVLLALFMSIYESMTGGENAYFDASVMLLFFLLIGRTLDHLMRERARGAVTRLAEFSAKGAGVIGDDGKVRFVPLSEIVPGTRIVVASGERFPVDGVVVSGKSDVDRSLVTGESESVAIGPEDTFEAGTLNLTGPVEAVATRTADKSFLSEVISMMEAAEHGKEGYVRIADRMAKIYAPAVHILAALTFLAWMVWSRDWHVSLYTAISVLIITCPCALGLAVPVVHVVGANRLFRDGIMMKDGAALERLAEATKAVFDKTGTITLGQPTVSKVRFDNPSNAAVFAALASRSHHPAAKAIARYLGDQPVAEIDEIIELPGLGIEAKFGGRLVRVGRPAWVAEISATSGNAENIQGSGTAAALQGGDITLFELVDGLRPDAGRTMAILQKTGLDPEILSGDTAGSVKAVASELGIETAHSELRPEQKIARISQLQQNGQKVLMVGDGINDAPALTAGHVSMAPASGSDIGRLAADLVFTRDSLSAITTARYVAIRANRLVRQNFAIAILYNCVAVPLAVTGYVTPLVAALAMSASSIVVVANSMRLNLTLPEKWLPPVNKSEVPIAQLRAQAVGGEAAA